MVIYVDVLIFLNTVVDFLLLSAVQCVLKTVTVAWRKFVAAFVSAMFSLYIFLPPLPIGVDFLFRLVSSALAVLICFGFKSIRRYVRFLFVFYAFSFIYAGAMLGIYLLLKPASMSVNNGVVYFDISPLTLITFSFVIYLVTVAFKKLFGKESPLAKRCVVRLTLGEKEFERSAMVDSGHNLSDLFSDSVVIIIDRKTAVKFFGESDTEKMLNLMPPSDDNIRSRFRLTPAKTVSGESVLPAVRLDSMTITSGKQTYIQPKPVAIISGEILGDDYSVIIPPEALTV